MGIQDLQTLLENEGVSVDLFRIGRNHAGGFCLVLDAEGCLDRLYGGFFSDWACGGQWARCVQFLSTLSTALSEHQVSLCVCFNGAHPSPPAGSSPPLMPSPAHWAHQQANHRQRVNSVLRHVSTKGTPPPKVWWVPPIGLHSCLRSALQQMNVPIMVSADDHHQEVVALCRERGYAGIIGCSGEYLAFQPPRYFSSSMMKLTYRSSLETKEFMVHDLAEFLQLPRERLPVMAALLGNTLLTEQHLAEFHKRLSNNQKKVTGDALVRAVCTYVAELPNNDLDTIASDLFGNANDNRAARFKQSVQYYVNGTKDGFLKYRTSSARKSKNVKKAVANNQKETSTEAPAPTNEQQADTKQATNSKDSPADAPSAETTEKKKNFKNKVPKESEYTVPVVSGEVLRTCLERHLAGHMSPALLHVLQQRQLTLPVLLEDEAHKELPSIHHLYRPVRQSVYAILFNLHHHHFISNQKNEKPGAGKAPAEKALPHKVYVQEWIYTRQNPGKTPEVVPAVMLDWPVPTVQRLWFGTNPDDRRRRMRAFLSCMRSDTPLMLNATYVPQHLLILATVLRFIMTSPIQCLRRQELDAFLATAFASDLRNPLHLQEMTLAQVSVRGIQLGALLMAGVEVALLANDACGAPAPLLIASPWTFFDGKLFQHKLARANSVKHLVQLCDNQVDVVIKVERMRKAILDGLDVEFAMPPLPMNHGVLGMGYPPPGALNWSGGRSRSGLGSHRGLGGARLEIAGVVVGQWGGGLARSSHRYPSQLGYVGYTPTPRGQYGSYARGGGRGRSSGIARGGVVRRNRHRQARGPVKRRSDNTNSRPITVSVNGKVLTSDEVKYPANGPGDSSSSEAQVDSTTEEQSSAANTDNNTEAGEAGAEAATPKATPHTTKGGKNLSKKVALKGKKKGAPKTEAAAKSEDNGQEAGCAPNKKLPNKGGIVILNGGKESGNGDHQGQGDGLLDN